MSSVPVKLAFDSGLDAHDGKRHSRRRLGSTPPLPDSTLSRCRRHFRSARKTLVAFLCLPCHVACRNIPGKLCSSTNTHAHKRSRVSLLFPATVIFKTCLVFACVYVVVRLGRQLTADDGLKENVVSSSSSSSKGIEFAVVGMLPAPPSWRNLLRSIRPYSSFYSAASSTPTSPVTPATSPKSTAEERSVLPTQPLKMAVRVEGSPRRSRNNKRRKMTTLVAYAADESEKAFRNLTATPCEGFVNPSSATNDGVRPGGPPPWQNPEDTDLYLYSAYYDRRLKDKPFVRIIGMMKGLEKPELKYLCQLWFRRRQIKPHQKDNEGPFDDSGNNRVGEASHVSDKGEKVLEVRAFIREVWWPHWDNRPDERKYRPYLISCPVSSQKLDDEIDDVPVAVSMSVSSCRKPTSYLKIVDTLREHPGFHPRQGRTEHVYPWSKHYLSCASVAQVTVPQDSKEASSKNGQKYKFVVCVKGLDFLADNTEQLLEWLEMQRLLGAHHVFAHIFRLQPRTKKALELYEKEGFLTLVPFSLPGSQPNEADARAAFLRRHLWQKRRDELVPYNDCFYRHAATADFVVPLDVDELILPRVGLTWSDLVDNVKKVVPNVLEEYASIAIQNVYFFKNATVHPNPDVPEFLPMTRQDQRSANFSKPGRSVKSFVVTSKALTVFNHYALHSITNRAKAQYWVAKELAQMNHYRVTCPMGMRKSCMNDWFKFTIKDDILMKYRDQLEPAIRKKLKMLERNS